MSRCQDIPLVLLDFRKKCVIRPYDRSWQVEEFILDDYKIDYFMTFLKVESSLFHLFVCENPAVLCVCILLERALNVSSLAEANITITMLNRHGDELSFFFLSLDSNRAHPNLGLQSVASSSCKLFGVTVF